MLMVALSAPLSAAAVSGQRLPAGGAAEALWAHLLPAHHPEERRQHLQDGQGTHTHTHTHTHTLHTCPTHVRTLHTRAQAHSLIIHTLTTHTRTLFTTHTHYSHMPHAHSRWTHSTTRTPHTRAHTHTLTPPPSPSRPTVPWSWARSARATFCRTCPPCWRERASGPSCWGPRPGPAAAGRPAWSRPWSSWRLR